MKLCCYDDVRLGVVTGSEVADISDILGRIADPAWPPVRGDLLVRNLDAIRGYADGSLQSARRLPLESVRLSAPILDPGKIIGAPVNYARHVAEAESDAEINAGKAVARIHEVGLFLKASSSLVGPSEGITLRFPERRTDHEVELAVVIGRTGSRISASQALSYVAGYSVGLDVTVRGAEERSLRKSVDSYTVLGPWLVTADEVLDPQQLELKLAVNGVVRQHSSTRHMVLSVAELIEFASTFYTLYPGDIILTGTPEGVSPLSPGDTVTASISAIGEMAVGVR